MDVKKIAVLLIGLCMMVAFSASSASAWGGGRHFGGGFYHGFHHGYGGGGYYWPYWGAGYSIVTPPIGAIVGYMPDGYSTFVINGLTYYYCNGYYFRSCPSGYVIVEAPVASTVSAPEATNKASTQASQPTQATGSAAQDTKAAGVTQSSSEKETTVQAKADDAVTVNIPNAGGGFTAVKLTKFKDGFKGPQGEFYPGHPTVDQLRALYGK